MPNQLARQIIPDCQIGEVCEMIANGTHYRQIALHFGCGLTTVFAYLNKPEHKPLVNAARENAAYVLVDDAAMFIAQAKKEPKLAAVYFQMASHNRWAASMIHGRQFSQRKVLIEGESEKEQVQVIVVEDAPYTGNPDEDADS